jgi:hypothetical protein
MIARRDYALAKRFRHRWNSTVFSGSMAEKRTTNDSGAPVGTDKHSLRAGRRGSIAHDVTIRWALPADLPALERVAGLDSKRLPAGPLLVATVDGQIWAALATLEGSAIADPFVPTSDLVGLLRARARQLRDNQPPGPVLRLEPLLARLR